MPETKQFTVYVGAALTGAPVDYVQKFLPELKRQLRERFDINVFDFIGLEGGTARDVYLHDRTCTETADLCVCMLDYPSTGLGMEIELRSATGKPCLFFAHTSVRVTRMTLGLLEIKGWVLHRYSIPAQVAETVHSQMLQQTGQTWT